MLTYLSRTSIQSIKKTSQQEIARNLCLAALVSPDLYTFGELVCFLLNMIFFLKAAHPIFPSLIGTTEEWLHNLVVIFDEANVAKYIEFVEKNENIIKNNV
jgi:hypothetical protein